METTLYPEEIYVYEVPDRKVCVAVRMIYYLPSTLSFHGLPDRVRINSHFKTYPSSIRLKLI